MSRRTQDRSIDISICPTELEAGDSGDIRDGDLVVASVKTFAEARYPDCRVSVQIGYRQGSAWALVGCSAEAGRLLMEDYWEQHADDESLYEGGGA